MVIYRVSGHRAEPLPKFLLCAARERGLVTLSQIGTGATCRRAIADEIFPVGALRSFLSADLSSVALGLFPSTWVADYTELCLSTVCTRGL